MVRPLTKCRKNGDRYERPPTVEEKTEEALAQALPTLIKRAAVGDRTDRDYLPSECMVHVIRKARRDEYDGTLNALIPLLFIRCERIVRAKLRKDRFENPDPLVDEVLERLGELFAIDNTDRDRQKLDFYECRFKRAVLALCINAVNRELTQWENTVSRSVEGDGGNDGTHDALMAQIEKLKARTSAGNGDSESLQKLYQAIEALPVNERDAVVLVHIMGYDAHSDNQTKQTAATICGVTGRTIFNRLARAAEKLSRFKEEL